MGNITFKLHHFLIALSYILVCYLLHLAVCSNVCEHGSCTGPDTCTCEHGWMGDLCDEGIYISLLCINLIDYLASTLNFHRILH